MKSIKEKQTINQNKHKESKKQKVSSLRKTEFNKTLTNLTKGQREIIQINKIRYKMSHNKHNKRRHILKTYIPPNWQI